MILIDLGDIDIFVLLIENQAPGETIVSIVKIMSDAYLEIDFMSIPPFNMSFHY